MKRESKLVVLVSFTILHFVWLLSASPGSLTSAEAATKATCFQTCFKANNVTCSRQGSDSVNCTCDAMGSTEGCEDGAQEVPFSGNRASVLFDSCPNLSTVAIEKEKP